MRSKEEVLELAHIDFLGIIPDGLLEDLNDGDVNIHKLPREKLSRLCFVERTRWRPEGIDPENIYLRERIQRELENVRRYASILMGIHYRYD
jgi:hypothetical protein